MRCGRLLSGLLVATSLLLPACGWMTKTPKERFCPVRTFTNPDGSVNQQYYAVERVCVEAWQKRLDAAAGD